MLATQAPQKIRGRSRNAHTAWRVLENKPPYSLLEIDIAKGVHHQIRVHAATMECPIVGDKLYNKKGSALLVPYHLLYCFSICLHTINGAPLHVNVSVPFRHTWYEWTADK